ncbi:MAG: zinc ribbon domain-containing protein [Oscillospiraceae bacterium]|nr:zinc ribbon domain-containing protein [Oscillospiraceae bacterium]
MFCVKCGAEIEDGTQFCPKCGATQEPPVQAAAEQVYEAAPAAAPLPLPRPARASPSWPSFSA